MTAALGALPEHDDRVPHRRSGPTTGAASRCANTFGWNARPAGTGITASRRRPAVRVGWSSRNTAAGSGNIRLTKSRGKNEHLTTGSLPENRLAPREMREAL